MRGLNETQWRAHPRENTPRGDTLLLVVRNEIILCEVWMSPETSSLNFLDNNRVHTYSIWFTAGTTVAVWSSSSRLWVVLSV